MPNVLISGEIGSEWRTILGHPQLVECMGICFLSLAHGSKLSGSDVYLHIVKNDLDFFLQIQPGYVLLDGLTWNFSGFFFYF